MLQHLSTFQGHIRRIQVATGGAYSLKRRPRIQSSPKRNTMTAATQHIMSSVVSGCTSSTNNTAPTPNCN